MIKLVVLVIAALVAAANGIIGGQDTKIEDIPYQVSIERKDGSICGGTILSDTHILTAATCLHDEGMFLTYKALDLKVRVGSSHIKEGGSVHNVSKIWEHEKFESHPPLGGLTIFDVAMIKLEKPIVFDETSGKIDLVEKDQPAKPYDIVTISGWGHKEPEYPNIVDYSKQLQSVKLVVLDKKACAQMKYFFDGKYLEGNFCADYVGPKAQGFCEGDSGGPVVINGKLAGIISFPQGCGSSPAVFTKVAESRDWIDAHLKL